MTLTLEQQQALDELMARVPSAKQDTGAGQRSPDPQGRGPKPDLLKTFLGRSSDEVQSQLLALLGKKEDLEGWLLGAFERNPLEAAFQFLGLASLAFYVAEREANPKIRTVVDAFYYISTCASVGYADIFAVTQTGRAIASLVMVVGPALAARALDRPARKETVFIK